MAGHKIITVSAGAELAALRKVVKSRCAYCGKPIEGVGRATFCRGTSCKQAFRAVEQKKLRWVEKIKKLDDEIQAKLVAGQNYTVPENNRQRLLKNIEALNDEVKSRADAAAVHLLSE